MNSMRGCSNRHLRRLRSVEMKRMRMALYKQSDHSRISTTTNVYDREQHTSTTDLPEHMETDSSNNMFNSEANSLSEKLKMWYFQYRPKRDAVNSLLKILNALNMDVPLSLSTLLDNKIVKNEIKYMHPGKYIHLGLMNHLEHFDGKKMFWVKPAGSGKEKIFLFAEICPQFLQHANLTSKGTNLLF
ncbi:hypothetical protein FF38_08909 [Lucilia cuprina]|uniref:Uncharacterized protein n=1 Tax=Lucilia cuprina TaxID=7375 RepID=A0A0L0BZ60_LUCCU|nr:hypothetical protein FF38_08909 [Lucilia cuprina]